MKKVKKTKKVGKKKKVFIGVLSFFITLMLGGLFLLYGPFPNFRNWLVTTAMTTMNHQYLAKMFYSNETIEKILEENKIIEPNQDTDLSIIDTSDITTKVYKDKYEKEILEHKKEEKYKMIEVSGKNYSGYLVAIYDPSKVTVVTSKNLGMKGQYLIDMAKENKALVAINGGGFIDENGLGTGAEVSGIVIRDGKILNRNRYTRAGGLIGFTKENKLYLGKEQGRDRVIY